MAKMDFYSRAEKFGHKGNLETGVTTVLEVKSLEKLKELLNQNEMVYPYFSANEAAKEETSEMDVVSKVYRYLFGGLDQLMEEDMGVIAYGFPMKVTVFSKKNLLVDSTQTIEKEQLVIYNCETVNFTEKGSLVVLNTDWVLFADTIVAPESPNSAINTINIVGKDGTHGQNGADGGNGNHGTNGADGSVRCHGNPGTNGNNGSCGGEGYMGTGHKSAEICIINELKGILTVQTRSGNGGNAGNGGHGGTGGNGGHGGNVHKGTCTDIDGGNGGNGGSGGHGGNGANGGNAGDAKDVPVIIQLPFQYIELVRTSSETSQGGKKSIGGKGANGGVGAEGGYGNCDGVRGNRGSNGSNGKSGAPGTKDGTKGYASEIAVIPG